MISIDEDYIPKNRYMFIRYGDNDFGFPMLSAVRTYYNYIVRNNCDVMEPTEGVYVFNTHPGIAVDLFEKMHASGHLEIHIRRLFCAHLINQEVERQTNGVYFAYPDMLSKIGNTEEWFASVRKTYDYIRIDISFHSAADFPINGGNGENCAIDLYTGAVWSI